ncbi:MAG: helix-turn-helix domain-containing protein [Thermoanaerobaculia bacterium]
MSGIPLGKREGLHLEFKAAEALKDPEKIAREVVAMLNAEGGEVWVGLREEDGMAVAVEEIPEPELSRQSVRDFLVDTIEPSPSSWEIDFILVDAERGSILLVEAKPISARRPYAALRKSGRYFWMRIADRLRVMDREEIRKSFQASKPDAYELGRIEEALGSKVKALQQEAGRDRSGIFWLRILSVPQLSLDLNALQGSNLFVDPKESGNRRTGKTFFQVYGPRGGSPRRGSGRLVLGESNKAALTIYRLDGIELRLPLEAFHAGHEPGASKPLYWLALMEMPISVFRLLSKILKTEAFLEEPAAPGSLFVCSIALLGLEGWTLRPFSPNLRYLDGWGNYLLQEPGTSSDEDFVLDKPLSFPLNEVRDQPDRCGFRLVSRIYEAFGFGPDQMPRELDQNAGRLILPE